MKTRIKNIFLMLALLAGIHQAAAQGARFFRISGPAATLITAFRPDATIVWSNAQPGGTYTVQTVSALPGGSNWTNYVQIITVKSVTTNVIAPAAMALIPAGAFTMGDTLDGETDAIPTISVTVSGFYMDTNLVSRSQWESVYNWATANGYGFANPGGGEGFTYPEFQVDWYDTVKWSNARSQMAGAAPAYYTDAALTQVYTNGEVTVYVDWASKGYRLPTEAEWEKAARGGLSGQRFPWGNTISESQANYLGNTNAYSYDLGPNGHNATIPRGGSATTPVGSFAANGYGLFDMAGNVEEWCWDWYGTPYAGGSDPHGLASGSNRILRSGDWNNAAFYPRCADRDYWLPNQANAGIGFRCVRGL